MTDKQLKKRMRRIAKMALDDDDDDGVLKRRWISKSYAVSKQWHLFSSEWCIDFRPGGRDMFGVNKEEICVSEYGQCVNNNSWSAK